MTTLAWLIALVVLLVPTRAGANVLVVGDSHTYITQYHVCPYPASWEVDAWPGRQSTEAYAILDAKLRRRHDRVVFDIATNDRKQVEVFRVNLERVWNRIGPDRELILATAFVANAPASTFGVNDAIRRFADRHPQRVAVAQWADLAATQPGWWATDGVHFTSAGYEARRELVVETTRAANMPRGGLNPQ